MGDLLLPSITSANGQNVERAMEESLKAPDETEEPPATESNQQDSTPALSDRRKALFEPLEPTKRQPSAEMLLPPPDFDAASYPKGWLVGKKRKLVNVDVVESMRRIAVQEMNRKVFTTLKKTSLTLSYFCAFGSMS